MGSKTDLFAVNGKPLLTPDRGVTFSYEDLDGADAGRDLSGVLHRSLVRSKVGVWTFRYESITEPDLQYMESLFGEEPTFDFTHPSRLDASQPETTRCYRSKFSISWQNARTGLWKGYGFSGIAV